MTIDEILRHPPDQEIVFEGERLLELADALDNSGVCPSGIIDNIKKAKRITLTPVHKRGLTLPPKDDQYPDGKKTVMGTALGRDWTYE